MQINTNEFTRSKFEYCLFCKSFSQDFCRKWNLLRHPLDFTCTKFKRNLIFREASFRRKTFWNIFFLYFMIYFCFGIIPPSIDDFLVSLPGATRLGIGLIIVTSLVVGMISMLIFGFIGSRVKSRKRVFIVTNALWIMGYFFLLLSPNYVWFLDCIAISAVGTGAFLPLGFSMIGDLFTQKDRGKKFGLMQFGVIMGNGLGIIFGTFFGSFGPEGWRCSYLILVLISIPFVIKYLISGLDPERGWLDPYYLRVHGRQDYHITIKDIKKMISTRSLLGILMSVLIAGVAISTLGNWGIFYLRTRLDGEAITTTIYLIAGIGGLPGTIIGGKMGDILFKQGKRRGRSLISIFGLLFGGWNLYLFYIIFPSILTGFFGYFFTSFSIGNQFAIYSELCIPELRSSVNAMNGMMTNLGGIFGNLVISSLIQSNMELVTFSIQIVIVMWCLSSVFWILPLIYYHRDEASLRTTVLIRTRWAWQQEQEKQETIKSIKFPREALLE
jgi:MFS family permease